MRKDGETRDAVESGAPAESDDSHQSCGKTPPPSRLEVALRGARREVRTLALVWSHPRVRWYTKGLAVLILAYVASPVDLIPDFVPLLGQLDDVIVVLVGVRIVLWTVPPDVIAECRTRAESAVLATPWRGLGAIMVVGTWVILAAGTWILLGRLLRA